jgi:hypothetical protein
MRLRRVGVLGTTLLLLLAAGASPTLAQLPPGPLDPVQDIIDQLPLPELPLPTPTPTAVAPTPAPARTPAATAAATPASTPAAAARPPRPVARRVTTPAPVSRPVPRRSDRATAAPARPRRAAVRRVSAVTTSAPARRPAARQPRAAAPPTFASQVTGGVGEVVRAVPAAIWWALVGLIVVALGMAGNAYWQSRRRVAVEAQRAELLDDIGLLQSALLPVMPEALDGLVVSAAYRPADGPAAGGDFYDVFSIGDACTCVLLGDVSGHGRESVTQAALARYTLRTLLAAGHPPAEAFARADQLLTRELQPNFVTVIAGVYDPRTGELTYAKAGHAPPIVLGADHDPAAEEAVPPLGIGVGESWPEYRVRLGEGVSVCFFTDGLQDAQVGEERVGRAEIVRLLAAHDVPDAGRLLADLEVLADRMSDDTAAVVLRRR